MKKEPKTETTTGTKATTRRIEILRTTGCEVLDADGTTRTIDVKEGQVVENATPAAADFLLTRNWAKLL